jgi:spermidine/putrescine transport system substrate-binding protein
MNRTDFMHLLWRWQRGSISRRQFLGTTGLGLAAATLATAVPALACPCQAWAQDLGDRVSLTTWPN